MRTKPAVISLTVEGGEPNELVAFDLVTNEDEVYTPAILDGLARAMRRFSAAYLQDGGEVAWLRELANYAANAPSNPTPESPFGISSATCYCCS